MFLGMLMAAAAQPSAVTFRPDTVVKGDHVVLADVADLKSVPVPLRAQAANLPLAAFGPGQRRLDLDAQDLASRATALMPALRAEMAETKAGIVTVRRPPAPLRSAPAACVRVRRQVAAGEFLTQEDLIPSVCGSSDRLSALVYDRRSGTLRAARSLNADDQIAAPPRSLLARVTAGQKLYIRTTVGPVSIQRAVVAAQSARSGEALFVKASDGAVFAVPGPEPLP